ncbi:hypothetical protein C0991_005174, partial [Blastosporella zonata]
MHLHLVLSFLLSLTIPVLSRSLLVPLRSGSYQGIATSQGIEEWLGIRYAVPPVGVLRFKAPVPVAASTTVFNASTFGNACPQPSLDLGALVGEDCLVLNVFTPSGTVAQAGLPVLVWIHVGLFHLYQRVALEFVQDNIAAFGGDPDKVTIWGQGHLTNDASTSKNSPLASTYDEPDKAFSRLIAEVGCSAGPSALSCLRAVPFETLLSASNTLIDSTLNQQLWEPSVGPKGSIVPERASVRIRRGDFLKVPYLSGTNINEGTLVSTPLLSLRPSTQADDDTLFTSFIRACLVDDSALTLPILSQLLSFFPQGDPSEGSPFHTGNTLFDRAESWYTAQMFLGPRRLFFDHAAQGKDAQVWGYYFEEFIPGNNVTFGVAHATELQLLFGPLTGAAIVETEFANKMLDHWLNFVNDMNPGTGWPKFTLEGRRLLQLKRENITAIPD